MNSIYEQSLYLLPFDHRHSYVRDLFHLAPPLNATQRARIEDSKWIIYEGFLEAAERIVPRHAAAILVDETFGAEILHDARTRGYATAVSVENSGSDEFIFEYGEHFVSHLEYIDPTFAKVLVRYNPEGDAALNRRQIERLQVLSNYCERTVRPLMFELLVPPTPQQLAQVGGDSARYDLELRPRLMEAAIAALQDAGVEPMIWKIEGLACHEDCCRMVETVRREGREQVGCIVLGRGSDERKVIDWLQTAAQVDGFIGFAVGRTSFYEALAEYLAGRIARKLAVARIAAQYAKWAFVFEQGRMARRGPEPRVLEAEQRLA